MGKGIWQVKTHPLTRLMRRVTIEPDGCWMFTGPLERGGYARITLSRPARGTVMGHRLTWEMKHGPIPEWAELHHECERQACVNPDHVVPLTPAEHKARHRPDACRACGANDWKVRKSGRAGSTRQCRPCAYRISKASFPTVPCAWCGGDFVRTNNTIRCCSPSCAQKHRWHQARLVS